MREINLIGRRTGGIHLAGYIERVHKIKISLLGK